MTFPSEQVLQTLESLTTLSGAEREAVECVAIKGYAVHVGELRHGETHASYALAKRLNEIAQYHLFELRDRGVEV